MTGCTVRRYDQLETYPETIEQDVMSYLRVLRVRNNICKNFKCGFTHFVVAGSV